MRRAHAAGRFFAASLPTQPKSFDMGAFRPASDAPSSYWSATTKEKRYGIRSKYADGILFFNNRMQGTRPTAVAASRSTASSTIWPIAGGANTTRGLRSGGIARPSFEVPEDHATFAKTSTSPQSAGGIAGLPKLHEAAVGQLWAMAGLFWRA